MTTISRVALVTGGNRGIGEAIVRGLAREGFIVFLGARDATNGRESAARLAPEGDVRFIQLDVTVAESVASARQTVESTLGRLDVLINNAGVAIGPGAVLAIPMEESAANLRAVFETNVFVWSR